MLAEGDDPYDATLAEFYISDSIANPWRAAPSHSYTVIDVLKFLWGLPWNNLTLNWIAALHPTYVLATMNHSKLPKTDREVVVYLDFHSNKYFIHKIMQFCQVDTFGVKSASDLIERTVRLTKSKDD